MPLPWTLIDLIRKEIIENLGKKNLIIWMESERLLQNNKDDERLF